ncbi:zinc-binding dehydrogenase [Flavitalea flava]
MAELMNAICITPNEGVRLEKVQRPETAAPEHLIVKMTASAINPGDKAFISRPLPPGSVTSLYNVYGVSGAGKVIATGDGVPTHFIGKNVMMYRSLKFSEHMIGTWCEYAHVPFLDCVILPDNVNPEEYSGSMVNSITPYAFLKLSEADGHKGIISTAGSSATGIAMVGMSLAYQFPLISIVRNQEGKKKLGELGAKHVVAQDDADFTERLNALSESLQATGVFDGVGGEILNKIIPVLPPNSTIYSYGYLGDAIPLTVHTLTLAAKSISIRPFGNIRTPTVQDPENLANALQEIAKIIHMPHFKTIVGKKFGFAAINDALSFVGKDGEKAILVALH